MKKIVIFNVGGALSAYGEFDSKSFVVDLGKGNGFSPVNDFLLPLYEDRYADKPSPAYPINQLFLSHLDTDHISDYESFKEHFFASYLTTPNDNSKQDKKFRINRDKLNDLTDLKKIILTDMQVRNPNSEDRPLTSIISQNDLNYIYPMYCENNELLSGNYDNNISLTLFIKCGDKVVFMPGDLGKEGMTYLIENNSHLRSLLENYGVDYLVAPHHGLQTSFSTDFFNTIKGNKTRLNIISEKPRSNDASDNRSDVDGRYYNAEYSTGDNALGKKGVKTSLGHIVIDFEDANNDVRQYSDISDIVAAF